MPKSPKISLFLQNPSFIVPLVSKDCSKVPLLFVQKSSKMTKNSPKNDP
tara:strand:- start:267 stop:413 length:147 start_codon:yes stop_codon:yes gene_type:complete